METESQRYLIDLKEYKPDAYKIVKALRKIIIDAQPDALEKFMYGGLVYNHEKDLWGIFSRKNHVTLEFTQGYKMKDKYSVLEGTGKERRHIKIISYIDIELKRVKYYIIESGKLAI